MNQSDITSISRCEKGERRANIEMLLLYQLLFNVPINSLFEHQQDDINEDLIMRLQQLIHQLNQHEQVPKVANRIAFLNATLTRLTS